MLHGAGLYRSVFARRSSSSAEDGGEDPLAPELTPEAAAAARAEFAATELHAFFSDTHELVRGELAAATADLRRLARRMDLTDPATGGGGALGVDAGAVLTGLLVALVAPLPLLAAVACCLLYRLRSSALPFSCFLAALAACYLLLVSPAALFYATAHGVGAFDRPRAVSVRLLNGCLGSLDAKADASAALTTGVRLALLIAGDVAEAEADLATVLAGGAALQNRFVAATAAALVAQEQYQVQSSGDGGTHSWGGDPPASASAGAAVDNATRVAAVGLGGWLRPMRHFNVTMAAVFSSGFGPIRHQYTRLATMRLTLRRVTTALGLRDFPSLLTAAASAAEDRALMEMVAAAETHVMAGGRGGGGGCRAGLAPAALS